MHIIAVASSLAAPIQILLALCIAEISNWTIVCYDLPPIVEPTIYVFHSILSILLGRKFDVDISHNVVAQIVNHYHLFNLAEVAHLGEHILIELLKPSHGFFSIFSTHIVSCCQGCLHCRVFVHVFKHQSLADWRLVVNSLAAVTITAGTHLEEERTVDFVHFCAIDATESISH